MTPQERIAAVEKQGFTRRQAGFLVTVMLHSGVCMLRQYCAYAHLVHGQKTRDFFSTLVARRLATAYSAAHRRARIFHIHGKRLYTAISEPNNRNRKPITLGRAIERLMILDAVIAEPQMRWLGSEKEKVEYFRQATSLRVGELPSISFGQAPRQTVRYFPDKLPIGVTGDGRTHVFLYLINRDAPVDFRAFVNRHAELFRALPEWELRLLVPEHSARVRASVRVRCASGDGHAAALRCQGGAGVVLRATTEGRCGRRSGRSRTVPRGGPPVPRASIPGALSGVEEGWRCDSARDRLAHSRRRPGAADWADREPRAAARVSASLPLGWLGVGVPSVEGGRQGRELSAPKAMRVRRVAAKSVRSGSAMEQACMWLDSWWLP